MYKICCHLFFESLKGDFMKLTKKQQFLLFKLAILAIILMISGLGLFSKNQKKTSNKSNTNQTKVESSVDFSGYDKSKMYTLQVGKVADGDTFHVRLDGKEFKIRLLLIDTPETAKEGKAAQPFADQAKQKTEELLKKAKKVEGKFDVGDYTDKYGRALMYVYLDGKLLQQTLVEESLARVGYAHPPNTTLLKDLQKVEEQTKKKKKNIWEKDGYVTNRGFDPSVY